MSAFRDEDGSLAQYDPRTVFQKTAALRATLQRRNPRCRVCRDDAVRVRVDAMLDWVGIPVPLGPRRFHKITYADILRDLEPLNARRPFKDRVTYDSLLVHAKRHYDLKCLVDNLARQVEKEFQEIFGIPLRAVAKSTTHPGTNEVRRIRSDSARSRNDVE